MGTEHVLACSVHVYVEALLVYAMSYLTKIFARSNLLNGFMKLILLIHYNSDLLHSLLSYIGANMFMLVKLHRGIYMLMIVKL